MRRTHRVGTAIALALAVVVLLALLWPEGYAVNRAIVRVYTVGLRLGVPSSVTPEDYALGLNVLAFVPLGWLGVVALRWRPVVVVAALVGLSVAVELVQAVPGLSRDPSIGDVVLNGLGALVGVGLGLLARRHGRG